MASHAQAVEQRLAGVVEALLFGRQRGQRARCSCFRCLAGPVHSCEQRGGAGRKVTRFFGERTESSRLAGKRDRGVSSAAACPAALASRASASSSAATRAGGGSRCAVWLIWKCPSATWSTPRTLRRIAGGGCVGIAAAWKGAWQRTASQ